MDCRCLAWLLIACGLFTSADGAELRVDPTSLALTAKNPLTALRLSNTSDVPMTVQIRALRWTQHDATEQLTPSDDVIVSPPFVTIAPRTRQVVRVLARDALPANSQRHYRIVVDELPAPDATVTGDLKLLLRYVLPLSVTNGEPEPAALEFELHRRDGLIWLDANNLGERRARITELQLYSSNDDALGGKAGLVGYVHGSAMQSWVAAKDDGERYADIDRVSLRIDGKTHDYRLRIDETVAAQ